jgi:hypothetical protein
MRYIVVRGKMMQSKRVSIFNAGKLSAVLIIIGVGFVSAFLMTSQLQSPIIQTIMNQKRGVWEALGDAEPGTGKSGYLAFYIYPHAANPAATYAANLSNATAYEYRDATTGEMTKTTPYGTTFDFVVKYRLNVSDGYNTSSSAWTLLWSYVDMACNFNWTADIASSTMTDVQIASNANYIWINCYLNNGGAGYTISKGEKFSWNTSGWVLR